MPYPVRSGAFASDGTRLYVIGGVDFDEGGTYGRGFQTPWLQVYNVDDDAWKVRLLPRAQACAKAARGAAAALTCANHPLIRDHM